MDKSRKRSRDKLVFIARHYRQFIAQRRQHFKKRIDLTQLEAVLAKQETALTRSLTLLNEQNSELTTLRTQLQRALAELQQSKKEIQTLKASLITASNSIKKANQSLKEYEKEMTGRLRIAKWQRNIWVAVGVGAWAVGK